MAPFVLLYHTAANKWLHFQNPVQIVIAHQIDDVIPCLLQVDQFVNKQGLYAAGFISYEAAPAFDSILQTHLHGDFPLLWFGVYNNPKICQELPKSAYTYHIKAWSPSISRTDYEKATRLIKNNIRRGKTYQVNYTFRLQADFNGDAWSLFSAMQRAQPTRYAAYIDTGRYAICSASPELFFQLDDTTITCRPMKGTAARGKTEIEDRQQAKWLHHSEKNRAENVMIVDMIRNDLGRIAQIGSVQVRKYFEIEQYPTLWQMTSTVTAKSRASFRDLFSALFPCASITGAPKIATMGIIAELEKTARHAYTGCIGFIAPRREAQFSVAIRTAIVDRQAATVEYGMGSGIVWDSHTTEEYEECQMKAQFLKTISKKESPFSLIESLLWSPREGYFLLDYHFKRLSGSAKHFAFPLDLSQVEQHLHKLSKSLPAEAHKIRFLLHPDGSFDCQATPLAALPKPNPATVCLAPTSINSKNMFLYHKTTQRQVYEVGKALCPNCDEVLLWNEHGELTEAGTANIVVKLDGKLLTPPVSSGLLPGTFRSWLLNEGEIQEETIPCQMLDKCSKIYLINSVRKWRDAMLVDKC